MKILFNSIKLESDNVEKYYYVVVCEYYIDANICCINNQVRSNI